MDWINQDWMKVTGRPVEFFADETASAGKLAPEAKQRLAHLASEVSACVSAQRLYKGNIFRGSGRICGGACVVERCCGELRSDVITASQVGVHALPSFVVDNEKFPSPP
ncbi:hypothetical protein GQ600_6272 [Phytophthora cactorum]|nr:hypothetical protein GQ600_6272 [Phytophthora cactorum]